MSTTIEPDDLFALRHRMYRHVADSGSVPDRALIDEWAGGPAAATTALAELHDRHLVVLGTDGDVAMMLPFAAIDTGHVVHGRGFQGNAVSWFANCAWDSFAVPIALGCDADIEATWLDTGEPVDLGVRDGELTSVEGFVQWMTPARRWWDDIADT